MAIPKDNSESVRERILDAANQRFSDFGYGKTTMAEIARDCEMSAANLYRYFENKQDIGALLACRCLAGKAMLLNEIVARADLGSSDKIREMILLGLRYTYDQWQATPRMNELVDDISRARHDIVEQHMRQRHDCFLSVIQQGNTSGEFAVTDPTNAAQAILSATFLFDYPNLMAMFPLQTFEHKAEQVADLLLHGLRRR